MIDHGLLPKILLILLASVTCTCKHNSKNISSSHNFTRSLGYCLSTQYAEPISPSEGIQAKGCPKEDSRVVPSGKLLVRCQSFKDDQLNEFQWLIYDRTQNKDGSIRAMTQDDIANACAQLSGKTDTEW